MNVNNIKQTCQNNQICVEIQLQKVTEICFPTVLTESLI